jgi:hypothetical protein
VDQGHADDLPSAAAAEDGVTPIAILVSAVILIIITSVSRAFDAARQITGFDRSAFRPSRSPSRTRTISAHCLSPARRPQQDLHDHGRQDAAHRRRAGAVPVRADAQLGVLCAGERRRHRRGRQGGCHSSEVLAGTRCVRAAPRLQRALWPSPQAPRWRCPSRSQRAPPTPATMPTATATPPSIHTHARLVHDSRLARCARAASNSRRVRTRSLDDREQRKL